MDDNGNPRRPFLTRCLRDLPHTVVVHLLRAGSRVGKTQLRGRRKDGRLSTLHGAGRHERLPDHRRRRRLRLLLLCAGRRRGNNGGSTTVMGDLWPCWCGRRARVDGKPAQGLLRREQGLRDRPVWLVMDEIVGRRCRSRGGGHFASACTGNVDEGSSGGRFTLLHLWFQLLFRSRDLVSLVPIWRSMRRVLGEKALSHGRGRYTLCIRLAFCLRRGLLRLASTRLFLFIGDKCDFLDTRHERVKIVTALVRLVEARLWASRAVGLGRRLCGCCCALLGSGSLWRRIFLSSGACSRLLHLKGRSRSRGPNAHRRLWSLSHRCRRTIGRIGTRWNVKALSRYSRRATKTSSWLPKIWHAISHFVLWQVSSRSTRY